MKDVEILEIIKQSFDLLEIETDTYDNGSGVPSIITKYSIDYIQSKIDKLKEMEK